MTRTLCRYCDQRSDSSSISRGRFTNALREECAEAAETGEADLHAHVGHRVLAAGEQRLRELDTRRDAELMRRHSEHGLELPDEMKRRDADLAGELLDRRCWLPRLAEQIARAAQPTKPFMSEQHVDAILA